MILSSKGDEPFNAETTIDFSDPNNPQISFSYPNLKPLEDYFLLEKHRDLSYFYHRLAQYLALLLATIHYWIFFRVMINAWVYGYIQFVAMKYPAILPAAAIVSFWFAGSIYLLCLSAWMYIVGSASKYLHNKYKILRDIYASTNAMITFRVSKTIDFSIPYKKHYFVLKNQNILIYDNVSFLQFDLDIPDSIMSKIKKIYTIATEGRKTQFAKSFKLVIEFSELPTEGMIELVQRL